MTATGHAWILSKKNRTLRTSSAEVVLLGQFGTIITKSRNEFVQSESLETGAMLGSAQRRHRDRLRWHRVADDCAVEEHRILLAPALFQTAPPPKSRRDAH